MRLNTYDKEMLEVVRSTIAAMGKPKYSIPELALLAGMSESKLKGAFKRLYGFTIHQYSIQIRMEKARQLIEEDRKSLSQIAAVAGFGFTSNFIAAFKKYYGHTPGRALPH